MLPGGANSVSLAVNALRAAEPIDFDSKLGQRLLDDPRLTELALDQHRPVRDPTGEHRHQRLLIAANQLLIAEVNNQRAGLLDVEDIVGCRHRFRWLPRSR